jgi:hypothetical protein
LLRAHPSNHGLPIEVKLPILFPLHDTYDHDDSTVIPILDVSLARLIFY